MSAKARQSLFPPFQQAARLSQQLVVRVRLEPSLLTCGQM
jgi:hypothetical protein